MNNSLIIFLGLGLWLSLINCSGPEQPTNQSAPNILLIIVDDLGYSDLGCYGSEISTNNIDALAAEGIRFTKFYASPNCSPSRAMLMSGMDHHQAGIGAMVGPMTGPNQKGKPGYEGYLNESTVAFSELLQDNGYNTYYAGKWHLGSNNISNPNSRGFDKAWWQVGGSPSSHFNLSTPVDRPNYFENDRPQRTATDSFYSSDFYTDKLIEYIGDNDDKLKPFLGVLSFSAVHIPIHCPDDYIDLYKGNYKEGYEALRISRLETQKNIGIVSNEVELAKLTPNARPWDDLSAEEQLYYARRMEVYAGMVDNMDDNVGKVVDYLKSNSLFDNTLIVFMSDNGGAGFDGWQSQKGKQRYAAADNTIENLGKKGSINYLGAGWGSAISTPFRLFKRHVSEGGIRIPMIIGGGYLKTVSGVKGSINHNVFTLRDIAPTIQEIVGVTYPMQSYKGRDVLPQSGKSFASILKNIPPYGSIHSKDEIFGWELFKRKAVQKNGWKILWLEPEFGKGTWELFNLDNDPTEQYDLAQQNPQKLKEMISAWEHYKENNNVIISDGELFFP